MQFSFTVSANLIKFFPSTNLNLKSNKAINENSIIFHNIYENNRFSVKKCSHVLQFKVFWDYESTIIKRIRASSFIAFLQKSVTAFHFSLIFLELTSYWSFCRFAEQWWRSGESTRLPPMWPGFDSWAAVVARRIWFVNWLSISTSLHNILTVSSSMLWPTGQFPYQTEKCTKNIVRYFYNLTHIICCFLSTYQLQNSSIHV